jgi:hypothetical protein
VSQRGSIVDGNGEHHLDIEQLRHLNRVNLLNLQVSASAICECVFLAPL